VIALNFLNVGILNAMTNTSIQLTTDNSERGAATAEHAIATVAARRILPACSPSFSRAVPGAGSYLDRPGSAVSLSIVT